MYNPSLVVLMLTLEWPAHPDPTLQRNHLRDFGKRLKKAYGWSHEQFVNFGVEQDDEDED